MPHLHARLLWSSPCTSFCSSSITNRSYHSLVSVSCSFVCSCSDEVTNCSRRLWNALFFGELLDQSSIWQMSLPSMKACDCVRSSAWLTFLRLICETGWFWCPIRNFLYILTWWRVNCCVPHLFLWIWPPNHLRVFLKVLVTCPFIRGLTGTGAADFWVVRVRGGRHGGAAAS